MAAQLLQDHAEKIVTLSAAEIDKAILDALLRATGTNFFDGMVANVGGIDARLSRDLDNDDIAQFLAGRKRLERVAIRHTVGMDDKIEGEGGVAGFAKGGAKVDLADRDGGTLLTYNVEAQIGGKLAQLGQRLINGTAKKLADEFFVNFARSL